MRETENCSGSRLRFSIWPIRENSWVLGWRMASFSFIGGAGLGIWMLFGS